MANGNGSIWVTIGCGVAVLITAAAILGTASTAGEQGKLKVRVTNIEADVDVNTKRTDSLDVMQKQVDIIEQNVGKILDKMDK